MVQQSKYDAKILSQEILRDAQDDKERLESLGKQAIIGMLGALNSGVSIKRQHPIKGLGTPD